MTASQTFRVRAGAWLASVSLGFFGGVACGGAVRTATGSSDGSASTSSGSASSSGFGSSGGSGSNGGSASSSGAQGASSGGSSSSGEGPDGGSQTEGPLDASIDLYGQPAPKGLAAFAFVVNGVEQTPLACPAESWEYPPPTAQTAPLGPSDGTPGLDTICNGGRAPCPGLRTLLINTGQYAVAYTAQTIWQVAGGAGQPPGVPFGNMGELSGVLNPGDEVDITSVYVGGITAVLGSSRPFVDPDAGKYVADGAMIPWPAGVAGSDGASQMYVAEIEIVDSCRTPSVVW
jgi:hypothetical protein